MASVTERRILDASRHIAGPDKVPALRPAYVRATRRVSSQWKITSCAACRGVFSCPPGRRDLVRPDGHGRAAADAA